MNDKSNGHGAWREPQLQREPCGEPFRSCSYCGSIHPEDLIKLLKAGATLHGADWKYGWPHKFYVEGIPNPQAGKQVNVGGVVGPDITSTTPGAVFRSTCGHQGCKEHGYWQKPFIELAPLTTRAKFYNEHLKDCLDELFAELAPLLELHAGIKWSRDSEGKLHYGSPSVGYQR